MPMTIQNRPPIEEMIQGVVVRDPFRWLEDRSSLETEEWVRDQKKLCDDYFAKCEKFNAVRARVSGYLDVEATDQPTKIGERYFYRRRNRGEEQGSLYAREGEGGREHRLVDPSSHGPFTSVGIHRISDDAKLLAYDLRDGGTDRRSIHIMDVESGITLPDSIPTGYARGFAFAPGGHGFYYCHETESSNDHTIRLCRFEGTASDQVCFRQPRTAKSRLVLTCDDERLGVSHIRQVRGKDLLDLWITKRNEPTEWKLILANRPLPFIPILKGGSIYAMSYESAPNGRLVELDERGMEMRSVIPERHGTIRQIVLVSDLVFLNRVDQMQSSIECWNVEGGDMRHLDLWNNGTLQLVPNQYDSSDTLFYASESFTQPPKIFEYTISTRSLRLWHQSRADSAVIQPVVQRTSYISTDGTQIPVRLVASDLPSRAHPRASIMSCYGGFGVAVTPQFSVLVAVMVELGATFALPSIRGGGEFGKVWHDAARGRNRQVAFDDFIAAAEWLCDSGTTTQSQLAIFGGSNSGLLVGAAMTQRPDLFQTVVCIAPLLDMVRYEVLSQRADWRQEYGAVNDPQDFQALYAYSPYHRVDDSVDYPSVLFVSGDSDDRCNPAHVRKMAALLQSRKVQRSPVIVDYSKERGHSPVLPLTTRIDALARRIMFLCRELDIPVDFGGEHETSPILRVGCWCFTSNVLCASMTLRCSMCSCEKNESSQLLSDGADRAKNSAEQWILPVSSTSSQCFAYNVLPRPLSCCGVMGGALRW